MVAKQQSSFPIPASLHDLERDPYNLLPYPFDFNDEDEAARADSFLELVHQLEQGNRTLSAGGIALFEPSNDEEDDTWMDEDRVQAFYTLVRKSTSLAPETRARLVYALCQALKTLAAILDTEITAGEQSQETQQSLVMPQSFRDAFACHLYMLFSIMFFAESEAKIGKNLKSGSGNKKENAADSQSANTRAACAEAMCAAARAMANNKAKLWKRSVPDEAVVVLPCRIAFQMLESASGVVARKASSADLAMEMIASAADSTDGVLSTIVAALMDLMHSYEHMAQLCAQLCCMVPEKPTNRLATDLLREIGRLNTTGMAGNDAGGKASGIRNVAPFIFHLAALRPRLVLNNMAQLMPHLDSEVHNLRSAIVTAIANIVSKTGGPQEGGNGPGDEEENQDGLGAANRSSLLDILRERVRDVSSFTRATALKAWISLVQTGSLPVEWYIPVTELAIDRLNDKTIVVRRQSMQLLTTVLENNPFMGDLEPGRYRVRREELRNFIKNNLPENIQEAHEAALEEAARSDDDAARVEIEEATIAAAIADVEAYQDEDELTDSNELLRNKVKALRFTQSCLDFIELFENANDTFNFMLHSKLQSDVTEALRFYVQARHFKLPCAVSGMKNALTLMWSTEQPIRDECRKTFIEIFLAEPGTEGKKLLSNDKIAENLLVLVGEATVSELASIEEGIISLVKDEMIPADVFLTLWSIVSKGSMEAKSSAMQVISMGASADKSIIDSKSRLKLLLDSCLGDDTEHFKDWRLARTSACALQKVDRAVPDEGCAKYLVLERILEQLAILARGDWCSDNDRDTLEWFSASEEAVKALFVISPNPEEACSEIVRVLYLSAFRNVEGSECHSLRLARFFHVLGNIALNLLCYTEELSSGVRQANAKKSLSKQVEADTKKAKKKKQQPQDTPRSSDSESENEIEAELGIAAEVEAETERQMSEITETEILGKGLIHAFAPLLVKVVGNEGGKFGFEILMQASMLCLCKFMCVSASFCEKHLPLVFSALSRAEGDTMKANTVVALGDLAFRFPNSFEPYTAHLYTCLRDPSTKVRRHTLMVLTHLILNDMIKLRTGQGEIVLCLQDDDGRIRDMAGLLFHSLASRSNNPIYNLLPDIISQLSQCDVSRESFRSIMVFLLGFVQKERQSTMLTEKLTLRLDKTSTISQKADLVYCISQLKQTEKSIKYLVDNFKLYKDSLFDEEVSRSFISVIAKTKKSAKPELKALLEDWEGRIKESSELSKEDNAADTKAAKAARRRRTAKKKTATKRDSEEVEAESEKENNLQEAPATRRRRTAKKKPTKKMVSDGDEADLESEKENNNSDEEEQIQAPSRRRAKKIDQPEMMDIDAPRRHRRAAKK